ncbi:hypothetical protein [Mesorhizobium sp. CN2-181]|uniref:hypothetical protein n=1 Tax=Mesorhizobium yinganensis TaxID=3157707 RepID=UPI0032B79C3A
MPASAQQCDDFNQPITSKGSAEQMLQPFSNDLLVSEFATSCLVSILTALKPRIVVGVGWADEDVARLIQATGALRSILANGGPSAIRISRSNDNLDSISTLVTAARGNNQTARVNSAIVLADVIDNSGLCVVIDHLYDPDLGETNDGKSGRVNLLSIASVVAPWAYRENFENLGRLRDYIGPKLQQDNDAKRAMVLYTNLVDRMNYQNDIRNPNMKQDLPSSMRECYSYVPVWANKTERRLTYDAPPG